MNFATSDRFSTEEPPVVVNNVKAGDVTTVTTQQLKNTT